MKLFGILLAIIVYMVGVSACVFFIWLGIFGILMEVGLV